jgi:hypothetical protein
MNVESTGRNSFIPVTRGIQCTDFYKTHAQNTYGACLLYKILMKSIKNMDKAVLRVYVTNGFYH